VRRVLLFLFWLVFPLLVATVFWLLYWLVTGKKIPGLFTPVP